MPLHDWTRVNAGVFHDFHTRWISHLTESLNAGVLPPDYYAMAEQRAGSFIADVLALHLSRPRTGALPQPASAGQVVAEPMPKVSRRLTVGGAARLRQRRLVIRHVGDDRIVALLEIVSTANKDRSQHVDNFVAKVTAALEQKIHVSVVDLFPPGPHDAEGIVGAIWHDLDESGEPFELPADAPLTLAAFNADPPIDIWCEHLAVGQCLKDIPLYLTPEYFVNLPLASTYEAAYRGMPAVWREVLEASKKAEGR